VQIETITHAEPLVAARAGETIEMVDVVLGSHHHLESRYGFATGSTITCRPKQSQIVALAHDQIGSRVERRAHFAEPAVAAAALEAIFMPVDVQRLQEVPVFDEFTASAAAMTRRPRCG